MTIKEVINDLRLTKIEYLRDKGFYPSAIDYAITFLQEKLNTQVMEFTEKDFEDDLLLMEDELPF